MLNSASETLAALSAARMGWMTGQLGSVEVPEFSLMESKEAHLRLLAMDAQLRSLAAAPHESLEITYAADLAVPARVYPTNEVRDRFRRLWTDAQQASKILLLRLMDRRGYIAHPFDFIPELNWDGLPDTYVPLIAWHRAVIAGDGTAESAPYVAYSRKEAQHHYSVLRAGDPARAKDWLVAELKEGNAQNRLRLLKDLANQFDQSDVDFLTEMQGGERSSKVKELILRVLRRLGAKIDLPTDLGALDYIERTTRGLLRRRVSISAPATMNTTRVNLLNNLISQMGFADIATHLALSETELMDAWDWEGSHASISNSLRRSILETGSDAACSHLLEQFPSELLYLVHLGADEMQRLSSALRDKAIEVTIETGCKATNTFWRVPEALCNWRIEGLTEAQSKALWVKAVRHPNMAPPKDENAPSMDAFSAEIFKLAMCLQPKEAQLALDYFTTKCALHSADPLLAPLHFNIALPPVPTDTKTERP